MNLDGPFRGSAAVAAGLVTRDRLYGPRFRRVFPDVYVPATAELNLRLRSHAAAVYAGGSGVVVGYSAAELWGASCARADAPAEVTVPGGCRGGPGLVVHRFRPAADEVTVCAGVALTTAARTAYDLGRRPDRTEAVVAIDALASDRFSLDDLRRLAARHRGERGQVRLRAAMDLADPRSGSPMETRIRVAIHRYRLPPPELQFPVGPFLLDLAYPQIRLAIEYDGREHLIARRALRDLRRQAWLTRENWDVVRLEAGTVFRPHAVAVRVHRELVARGAVSPTPLDEPRW